MQNVLFMYLCYIFGPGFKAIRDKHVWHVDCSYEKELSFESILMNV